MTNTKRLILPLAIFLLPFVLWMPLNWLIYNSPWTDSFVSPELDEQQRSTNRFLTLLIFWIPLAAICIYASTVILAYMFRQNFFARAYLFTSACLIVAATIFMTLRLTIWM